jgi:hypothetical protein
MSLFRFGEESSVDAYRVCQKSLEGFCTREIPKLFIALAYAK